KISRKAKKINVRFILKNTGSTTGKEAAQLYVKRIEKGAENGYKELKAFDKIELKAGESRPVSFQLGEEDFSFFDESANKWIKGSGKFSLLIGSSSRDIRLSGNTRVP